LEHQAIPGLMEAMTMGFPLRDPGLASGLKAGDSVAFTLDVTEDEMTVVSLKKR
jgi:protein SCO1/2